ncbi:MAG: pyridoxal phosphate-dependent aminotransferase [Gemmatimonadetes bacterium]|nr:pyridoxal phosphate-dependent aminotransferase [Gemmatimonadota bacterium]NNM05001.1 pyridoxal phosphate-dependent aminotransferase [Gemmatimonadota bacterium]
MLSILTLIRARFLKRCLRKPRGDEPSRPSTEEGEVIERKEERLLDFSQNVQRLQPSATIAVSSLAKQLKAEGRDIINLGAGEPDFDTPEWISDAGVAGIRDGKTRYTPAPGTIQLRQAIAGDLQAQFGIDTDWNGVVVSNGAKHSLFNACFSLFGPGDEVLIGSPYWVSYPQIVTLSRAEPVFVSGSEEKDFLLTPDDLDSAVTDRTRGLILCSPSNPSGGVYSYDELKAVAEWARDRGVWLIADEIYRYINFLGDGPSAGVLNLPADSLGDYVLVDGVSKAFAMTGWRIGFTYSSPELAKKMSAFQSHTTSNPSSPAQEAALAAYTERAQAVADVEKMVEAFRRRRDLVTKLFEELLPTLSYVKPNGAFYLFFRVDSLFREGMSDSSAVCTWLLKEAEIAMVPGVAFGDDRYVRMSYATSDDLLEKAIGRLAKAVDSLD